MVSKSQFEVDDDIIVAQLHFASLLQKNKKANLELNLIYPIHCPTVIRKQLTEILLGKFDLL